MAIFFKEKIGYIYMTYIFFFFVENYKPINIHIKLTKHNNLIYIIYFLI